MKHVENSAVWINVIASLMAAGVDRRLAVGIVDILVENALQSHDEHHMPLILSKCQMLDAPSKEAKVMEGVDQIMPRLFSITQQLLAAPSLKRKHECQGRCKIGPLGRRKSRPVWIEPFV
ncbi:hypothetical protein [Tritonibacter mobilis]|uniref:hypothetical protein n=1 Tax=Tritonibacter mobilis TaxID=379347 RepID=UPI0014030E5E|nr:hypothetical protein [Tritonibacter mobilis]NHM25121.1 hypothetical protein [Tritonibacter mobilis]